MSDQKLKICLVGQKIQIQSRSSDTGLLWPIAQGLTKLGHDVTIISDSSYLKKAEVLRDQIKAYYLYDEQNYYSKSISFQKLIYKKFIQLHKKNNFDLVHSLDDSGYEIGRHKKAIGIRMAYDINAIHLSTLFSILTENNGSLQSLIKTSLKIGFKFLQKYFLYDRSLLQTADGMFTTTSQQRTLLENYYLYPDYHTYTVPYGIHLGSLDERSEPENLKLKYQIPENSGLVIAFSDFSSSTELEPLLQAFKKILLKDSNFYLVILGDGSQWKKTEYSIFKNVLSSRVKLINDAEDSDLLNFICACDVYVNLSARTTGLEPSMIEAMAQKKIVISSELSPISSYITHQENGFLVRPADQEMITKLLTSILYKKNDFDYSAIGECARSKVLDSFNRENMINALVQSYNQIISKSHSPRPKIKRRDS